MQSPPLRSEMTHKELTAHIRGRLKVSGIKARCRMVSFCGEQVIKIVPPTADGRFTDDEQRTIRQIAVANRLTGSRGMAIDIERMTDTVEAVFYLGYE